MNVPIISMQMLASINWEISIPSGYYLKRKHQVWSHFEMQQRQ